MADTIKIKGGSGAVPRLVDREIGYRNDEKALYIGTKEGNVRLCGADDINELKQLIDDIITRLEALEQSEEPSE